MSPRHFITYYEINRLLTSNFISYKDNIAPGTFVNKISSNPGYTINIPFKSFKWESSIFA